VIWVATRIAHSAPSSGGALPQFFVVTDQLVKILALKLPTDESRPYKTSASMDAPAAL